MIKFTKEQLVEKLERRLAVTTHYPDLEEAQLDAEIFKIALAALTAEPCGYVHQALHEGGWLAALSTDHEAHRNSTTHVPVYRLPLLEGLK